MIAIPAQPFPFALDPAHVALVVIDMQRDFLEKGGFGETLGNDLTPVIEIVPTVARLLAFFRIKGWPILHTRECHLADLSDCPPAKRLRGNPSLRIGDPGPMGRILVRGEPGASIVPECAPIAGEMVVDKPGKGMFYGTDVADLLRARGVTRARLIATEACRSAQNGAEFLEQVRERLGLTLEIVDASGDSIATSYTLALRMRRR